jgi:miniconductance mechanosensitive channel
MQSALSDNPLLSLVGALAILVILAWLADVVTKRFFLGLVRRVAARTRSTWDDRMVERKVFTRLAHVAPAVVVYYGIGTALGVTPGDVGAGTDPASLGMAFQLVRRVALAFIVLTGVVAASNFLAAINDIYSETYAEAGNRPIKGYLQVLSIFLYIAAGIVIITILLSLVASVQIMSNDMIRIGDWVEMPQANADGDVIDIALHTVKIQNWDKTISAIPTHRFISESFKNWRGMSESGGRRIKRALYLDLNSVHFLGDAEIEHLSRHEFLRAYMREKRQALAAVNERTPSDPDVIPERRRLTNVGTFRAYVKHYLRNHPRVHQDLTLLVRQLAPGPKGLPLEIYCFTNDTAWASYEGIQADIFDHLIAILPEFGLRAYQEPAGRDFQAWRERFTAEG